MELQLTRARSACLFVAVGVAAGAAAVAADRPAVDRGAGCRSVAGGPVGAPAAHRSSAIGDEPAAREARPILRAEVAEGDEPHAAHAGLGRLPRRLAGDRSSRRRSSRCRVVVRSSRCVAAFGTRRAADLRGAGGDARLLRADTSGWAAPINAVASARSRTACPTRST